jgi:glycosyltransferase involved in cell wall biosynthesis
MQILVFPHRLELGGSQINAIDLATCMRARYGHEFTFFGEPGPAVALIKERSFRYVKAPIRRTAPSASIVIALYRLLRAEHFDLVHAWDWQQCLDALFAAQLGARLPTLSSIPEMSGAPFMPKSIPMTFVTRELAERNRAARSGRTWFLDVPVSTETDSIEQVDGELFRREYKVDDDVVLVVAVSRVVRHMKLEGLQRAAASVGRLSPDHRVRLIVVGNGDGEDALRADASAVNAKSGRPVVTLAGKMVDPRPAYAAADIVIGMSGALTRGMAFGKPAIVVGEQGFVATVSPDNVSGLAAANFYGIGNGTASAGSLDQHIARLALDPELRASLGQQARDFVRNHLSVAAIAEALEGYYHEVVALGPPSRKNATEAATVLARRIAGPLIPATVKRAVRRY